jgi:TRAP-type C4-dicarboxylate transport system substrate-binding protein
MTASISRRGMLAGSAATLALASGIRPVRAAETTFKISHYLPPSHGFHTDVLVPWGQQLEEKTDGKVKVEVYDATSGFGNIMRQADQVRAGVIDVALGLNGIPRGRFPASSIIELPFLVEKAGPGSKTLWTLYKEGMLGGEYDDFHVLALYTHHGGLIHTAERPVRDLEDLSGLRLRTPGPAVSAMLEQLGASPVGMPPAQIYENLQKGVINGVVTTWDLVGAIKLNELLSYHTDARAYVAGFHIVMNKEKYAALSDDVRAAVDELSGDNLVAKFGPWWDKWEARGREDALARGNTIIEISDETRAQWKAQLEPMIERYLESLEDEGVENPMAIYERAQELVAKFSRDG